jgi:hypothetical protein
MKSGSLITKAWLTGSELSKVMGGYGTNRVEQPQYDSTGWSGVDGDIKLLCCIMSSLIVWLEEIRQRTKTFLEEDIREVDVLVLGIRRTAFPSLRIK